VSAAKPIVYLDQNVLSVMARAPGGWRASDHGQVLKDFPEAEPWISPSHVVELVLHPDDARRTEMANMMLDMTDTRRIAPDYAFEVIEGFMQTLEKACPNILVSRAYLDAAINPTSQLFLAALALMATGRPPRSEVVESVTRRKVENRWLACRSWCRPRRVARQGGGRGAKSDADAWGAAPGARRENTRGTSNRDPGIRGPG